MQIVYHAAHSADAQLVRGLLAQEGIESFVFGDVLEGGADVLPVGGSVRVEVADEHVVEARAIIEKWQAAVPDDDEKDEAPDDGRGDTAAAKPDKDANLYAPLHRSKPARSRFGVPSLVLALVVGGIIGAVLTGAAKRPEPFTGRYDFDGDGKTDETVFYSNGLPERMETDRNRDGKIDQIVYYEDGLTSILERDDDFDGYREGKGAYRHNQLSSYTIDYDGDGEPDYRDRSLFDVVQVQEWQDKQGRVIKRMRYVGGRLVDDQLDRDGDGVMDIERSYDAIGEVTATRALPRP
ncbi:DUF2007 domain-containing protein [Lysobacter capsici]|uniref:putative signal transducing protein n=1 Tax=Lysobacter capsici TaxID=435897 RepID=UPI001C004A0F|nr:DUF2007 domain-containing protein [Lysobacter capsici]QWF17656.1 DUF2007 domain-containing protein [Lysobacter capsici]